MGIKQQVTNLAASLGSSQAGNRRITNIEGTIVRSNSGK